MSRARPGIVALKAKIAVNRIAAAAPATMNGFRTRKRSERMPTISRDAASKAQNQLPSALAFDCE